MNKNQLHIVIGVEHYNTTGLIRSLGEAGINPVYIAIKNKCKISSTSKYISKCHFVNDVEEGYALLMNEYGKTYKDYEKPIVYCIDDTCMSFLDYHYEEMVDRFVFFNAGEKGRINFYMDKYNILKLAKKCGLNILETKVCKRGEIPLDVSYPIITKSISPVVGGHKSDVFICKDSIELVEAYKNIKAETVLIQRFIEKENECEIDGISINHGNDVLHTMKIQYNYNIEGYYSPYMTVDNFTDVSIDIALKKMICEIGFEGIYQAEFLIDKEGNWFFSEINFRNSTWSYASTVAGMNLPYLFYKSTKQRFIPVDALVTIREPFTAMVEPIDYQKRVVERGMDKIEWLKDVLNCRCHYYYNKNDMEPFFEMIRNNERLR